MFIQARVCRTRPRGNGESDASAVSEALPFLEFDLASLVNIMLLTYFHSGPHCTPFLSFLHQGPTTYVEVEDYWEECR